MQHYIFINNMNNNILHAFQVVVLYVIINSIHVIASFLQNLSHSYTVHVHVHSTLVASTVHYTMHKV